MISKKRYDSLKAIFESKNIFLEDKEIILNSNRFEVAAYLTNNKLTDLEMFQVIGFLQDLIRDYIPKYAAAVLPKDRIKIQYRFMEALPQTAGRLTQEEKEGLAFCVYYPHFVKVYNEKNGEVSSGIIEFDSIKNATIAFEEHKKRNPELYNQDPVLQSSEKFGYSIDNPIQAVSVSSSYEYLRHLRYNNKPIKFHRLGSRGGKNGHIIDAYSIDIDIKNVVIYIDAYSPENSKKAPEHFTIVGYNNNINLN